MITVYRCIDAGLVAGPLREGADLPPGTAWIDLLSPGPGEVAALEKLLGIWASASAGIRSGIRAPTIEEMREIEPSSRLYQRGDALFMTASLLNKSDTQHPETRAVCFVLVRSVLVTIRYSEPRPFATHVDRIANQPEHCADGHTALLRLLDTVVDRVADVLEMVDRNVNELSNITFAEAASDRVKPRDFRSELTTIGLNARRASMAMESLVSLDRLLVFLEATLSRDIADRKGTRQLIKTLHRDIHSIRDYGQTLTGRLTFLLDGTLGMINIQQTGIIKIFSVVAVIFLPPTVVASMYGMNFAYMPELAWPWGYPFAIALMIASAILPYWIFKRRGWL